MSFAPIDRTRERLGAFATALGVVVQSALAARAYPAAHLDADLLSYLVYYRQLRTGAIVPFGYTVPKVLPVVLLGPLGDPWRAMLASIAVAAFGGAVLFLIAKRTFGWATGALAGAFYVLDPLRTVLTLRSSVDLYMGVALLAAILCLRERRLFLAALAILVAALGKPVAALAAVAILLVPGRSIARRLAAAALPFLALPATALLGAALDGRGVLSGFRLPDQHERFVAVAQGRPLGFAGTLHLILVEWFGGTLFARTWPLVALGVGLFAVRRLRPPEPSQERRGDAYLLLVPLLLVAAYLGLSVLEPMVVFTRFFWILTVTLVVLALEAAVTLARSTPGPRVVAIGVIAISLAALLADRVDDYRWRAQFMLAPFERYAAVARGAVEAIAAPGECEGQAIVPLAYLPLAAWRAPDKLERGELCAAEDWVDGRGCADPGCALFIPDALTRDATRQAVARLVDGGTVVGEDDGSGALVRWNHG